MKVKEIKVSVEELSKNYRDDQEGGVVGYDGRLNIRPAYQREFVYNDAQQKAVINSVMNGFPLNSMYWVHNDDGGYEVLDGQQRTISVCRFVNGDFSVNYRPNPQADSHITFFHNLDEKARKQILDYKVAVYVCEGDRTEQVAWFEAINTAGEKLNNQEIRNAIYSCEWVTEAKRWFSRSGCPAKKIGDKYMTANPIRQEILEKAINWHCMVTGDTVESYMAERHKRCQDGTLKDCTELWGYFNEVINWVKKMFPKVRSEMKKVDWGRLYNQYGDTEKTPDFLEQMVAFFMADLEVTNKAGIYEYVLSNNPKTLNLRQFQEYQKRSAYEKQKGICAHCGEHFEYEQMEGDHIVPWSDGGKTSDDNCQMLCKTCNAKKGNRY